MSIAIVATASFAGGMKALKTTQRSALDDSSLPDETIVNYPKFGLCSTGRTRGSSGTVIAIFPVEPNSSLRAWRRYTESPKPPTKMILWLG
jgi:hypothetical protein